jgi:hypothetical protein
MIKVVFGFNDEDAAKVFTAWVAGSLGSLAEMMSTIGCFNNKGQIEIPDFSDLEDPSTDLEVDEFDEICITPTFVDPEPVGEVYGEVKGGFADDESVVIL